MHLYETHLPVADTKGAQKFYTKIVGLPFAYRDPTRDIVFLWADEKQKAMIGLWGPNTAYGRKNGIAHNCHLAFGVPLPELFARIEKLNANNIETLGFDGKPTHEPTVTWLDAISPNLFLRSGRPHARVHQHFARSAEARI